MYIDHPKSFSLEKALMEAKIVTRLFLFSAVICFVFSLFQTAFFTSGDDIQGYWVLLIGWIGLVFFQFAWFANPLNLLALLLMEKHPNISFLLSLMALLLAWQLFSFSEIPVGFNYDKVFIKELGFGSYLWFLAQGLFSLAHLTEVYRKKAQKNED